MSASNNRKVTSSEILAVGAILNDREAIELLKKINDQVVTEEDTKGKRKQNDIFAFIGFAHQDDVLGEDIGSEEFQNKQGSVKNLVDSGLILEGFHIPLERSNEKKFGDVHLPATQNKVAKYKITEEGLTVLSLVNKCNSSQQQPATTASKSNSVVPDDSKKKSNQQEQQSPSTIKKEKAIANFKEEVLDENKL